MTAEIGWDEIDALSAAQLRDVAAMTPSMLDGRSLPGRSGRLSVRPAQPSTTNIQQPLLIQPVGLSRRRSTSTVIGCELR